MRRYLLTLLCLTVALSAQAGPAQTEKYLLEGKTTEAETFLVDRLKGNKEDDAARFELGMVRVLPAFERVSQQLYRYGLRTEKAFGRIQPWSDLMPQNPTPEKLSYQGARKIVARFVKDINEAEAILEPIADANVKVSLKPALIKLDLTGQGKPINTAFLFGQGNPQAQKQFEAFTISFDRGDVCWLRGYCHFLSGCAELLLAVDGKDVFETCGHVFFEKIESPYTYLQEESRNFGNTNFGSEGFARNISDLIAMIHQLRLPVKEPARCKAALEHFQKMLALSKEMWTFILAEKDDDNEWIPNPKQTSVTGVKVTQGMVDTWLETIKECEAVLEGRKLIPFWRGTDKERGVNLHRVFTEPRNFDLVLWIQGTAATPFLERGPLTLFSAGQLPQRINGAFGGMGFIGFAFWFN